MAEKPETERFLTMKEAAEILNVSAKGFHDFLRKAPPKSRPPMFRVLTNRVRFPHKEFLEWATSRRI